MASSIPAARSWLVDQLTAKTNNQLGGVLILRTGSFDDNSQNLERVTVGNARGITRDFTALGAKRLDERYTLPVHIETVSHGTDLPAVETRLWDLVTTVEQTVLADLTFGGALVHVESLSGSDEESGSLSNSDMAARFTLEIACFARVSLT
jgi:hypothetical protein